MKFFLCLALTLTSLFSWSQKKFLLMEDKTNQQHYAINEGRWLKVTYRNDMVFRGFLHIINDSVIAIGQVKLRLNGIKKIETVAFSANLFRALVITTAIVTFLTASVVVVIYFAGLIYSYAYNGPFEANPERDLSFTNKITKGVNQLYNVSEYFEKTFSSENYSYKVKPAELINKD